MMIITKKPTKTYTGTLCSTAEAKKQLRIESDFTDDDTYIGTLIGVARESVEDDINSDFMLTSNVLEVTIDGAMPTTMHVQQSPLIAVSKIEWYNGTAWADIPATDYTIEKYFHYFEVEFSEYYNAEKLRFTFTTGYADADRPAKLKQAALIRITDLYDNERQGYNLNVTPNVAYQRLISKHVRTYW